MPQKVIDGCIGCSECVYVCPVDCIESPLNPDRDVAFIHAEKCIDCMLCLPACPVEVIVPIGEWTDLMERRFELARNPAAVQDLKKAYSKQKEPAAPAR